MDSYLTFIWEESWSALPRQKGLRQTHCSHSAAKPHVSFIMEQLLTNIFTICKSKNRGSNGKGLRAWEPLVLASITSELCLFLATDGSQCAPSSWLELDLQAGGGDRKTGREFCTSLGGGRGGEVSANHRRWQRRNKSMNGTWKHCQ